MAQHVACTLSLAISQSLSYVSQDMLESNTQSQSVVFAKY